MTRKNIVEEKNHGTSKDRQEKEFQSFGQEQTFEKMCVKQIAKCEMDKERVFSAKNLSKSEDIPPDENITDNPSSVTAKVKAQPKKKNYFHHQLHHNIRSLKPKIEDNHKSKDNHKLKTTLVAGNKRKSVNSNKRQAKPKFNLTNNRNVPNTCQTPCQKPSTCGCQNQRQKPAAKGRGEKLYTHTL